MDLSIIIVSWNVREKLRENLAAVFKSGGDFNFEVFVVDNNSADGSAEMVRTEFPEAKLIANAENLGFAKANNQALRAASGRYVLLLNPDMRVFPDTLENMAAWMDNHKEAALAGCRLIDEKGNILKHVRRFPKIFDQLAVVLKLPHFFPSLLDNYLMSGFDYAKEAEVDSIRGAFFMIRQETLEKIGLLDERYFLWFEEVDYCRRVKNAGLRIFYTPAAECLDYVGQSFGQVKRGRTQKYFQESMLEYFRKWHPGWRVFILRLAWPLGRLLAFILGDLLRIKSRLR